MKIQKRGRSLQRRGVWWGGRGQGAAWGGDPRPTRVALTRSWGRPGRTGTGFPVCPIGTYTSSLGMTTCSACAANSNTTAAGASSAAACVCNLGYTGAAGGPCNGTAFTARSVRSCGRLRCRVDRSDAGRAVPLCWGGRTSDGMQRDVLWPDVQPAVLSRLHVGNVQRRPRWQRPMRVQPRLDRLAVRPVRQRRRLDERWQRRLHVCSQPLWSLVRCVPVVRRGHVRVGPVRQRLVRMQRGMGHRQHRQLRDLRQRLLRPQLRGVCIVRRPRLLQRRPGGHRHLHLRGRLRRQLQLQRVHQRLL